MSSRWLLAEVRRRPPIQRSNDRGKKIKRRQCQGQTLTNFQQRCYHDIQQDNPWQTLERQNYFPETTEDRPARYLDADDRQENIYMKAQPVFFRKCSDKRQYTPGR